MTTTQTEGTEVARYLAAIRDSLADLSAGERDDLLEDLEAHLHEVVAETGTSLEASLGSPQEYAEELRATAGLQPSFHRWRFTGLRLAWFSFASRPATRSVGRFLVALRPGWWLLRGWLILFTVVVLTEGEHSASEQHSLWIPTYFGTGGRAVVTTLAVALASAWVGTRTPAFTRPAKRAVFTFNALVIAFAIGYFPTFIDSSNANSLAPVYSPPTPLGLLLDGRQLQNIYPYDAQGHLLTNVRLYDDTGKPIAGLATQTDRGQRLVSSYPTDSTGHVVTNAYPQSVSVLPFVGPAASASAAALRGPQPASAPTAISSETVVPAPTIVVPPLATPAASKTP